MILLSVSSTLLVTSNEVDCYHNGQLKVLVLSKKCRFLQLFRCHAWAKKLKRDMLKKKKRRGQREREIHELAGCGGRGTQRPDKISDSDTHRVILNGTGNNLTMLTCSW